MFLRVAKFTLRLPIAASLAFAALGPGEARSEDFHWEFAGGTARFTSVRPFLPGIAEAPDSASNLGVSLSLTAAINLTATRAPVRLFLGVQHRYTLASASGARNALQGTYPVLRLTTGGLFLTVGATPLNWGETGGTFGLGELAPGDMTVLGEAGYLLPITPEVAFGFAASSRFAYYDGHFSGKPLLEGQALFRFYYGRGGSRSASGSRPGDYDGWRYPFGWMK